MYLMEQREPATKASATNGKHICVSITDTRVGMSSDSEKNNSMREFSNELESAGGGGDNSERDSRATTASASEAGDRSSRTSNSGGVGEDNCMTCDATNTEINGTDSGAQKRPPEQEFPMSVNSPTRRMPKGKQVKHSATRPSPSSPPSTKRR